VLTGLHPTAVIDSAADIADGVTVGPYSVIGPKVRIGAGTVVGPHVLIEGNTSIGERNQVFHGAAIGSAPQDFSYTGDESDVQIGDDNIIREFVTIQPGTKAGTTTRIGNHNMLMGYGHVAHNCEIQNNTVLANVATLAGYVTIEDYAIVGGIVPIHQFVRIGCHSIVGGASRITQDVAPYCKVAGSPPRTFGLNTVGLKRRGFSPETIAALKTAYRIFFRSQYSVREAAERIETDVDDLPEIKRFVAFVRRKGRGITR